MKIRFFFYAALPTVLLAACNMQWVREVRRTPTGGELALMQQNSDAQQQAAQLMQARCPQGYAILEEGEHVVGQSATTSTNVQQQRGRTWFGNPVNVGSSQSQTQVRDQTEWRIKYQCTAGKAPASPNGDTPVASPPPQAAATYQIVIR
jgi:hypothetical protein